MRIIITLAMLILSLSYVSAQNVEDKDRKFSLSAETGYQIGLNKQRHEAITITANFGYHFDKRWSIHLPISANTSLLGNKSYDTQLLLGIAPEYVFGRKSRTYWSLTPKIQASCFGSCNYMLYDIGIKFHSDKSPYTGIGFQFIDPYNTSFNHSYCIYVCFGFRI